MPSEFYVHFKFSSNIIRNFGLQSNLILYKLWWWRHQWMAYNWNFLRQKTFCVIYCKIEISLVLHQIVKFRRNTPICHKWICKKKQSGTGSDCSSNLHLDCTDNVLCIVYVGACTVGSFSNLFFPWKIGTLSLSPYRESFICSSKVISTK